MKIQRGNGFLDLTHCTAYANNGQTTASSALTNAIFAKIKPSGAGTASCSASTINDDTTYELCCTGQAAEDSEACNAYAVADTVVANGPQCSNITDDNVYGTVL